MSDLYFAYGSNLDEADLRRAGIPVADLERVGLASISDRELAFTRYATGRKGGVLDARKRKGSILHGVVFRVRIGTAWVALDEKEGAPTHYRRFNAAAVFEDGHEEDVVSYEVVHPNQFVEPAADYVRIVEREYEAHGLDVEALKRAASNSPGHGAVNGMFVYGTLMRGESRFDLIKRHGGKIECVIVAERPGVLYANDAYPMACSPQTAEDWIRGEFLRVTDILPLLEALDVVEGVADGLYRRRIVSCGVGDGRVRTAWAYVMDQAPDGAARVESGCWRTHQGRWEDFCERLVAAHVGTRDPARVARAVVSRAPFPPSEEMVARSLPLAAAFLRGDIEERGLCQALGNWTVLCE